MSQDWVANLYTTTTVVDTTMTNVELMFATLKSSFSGTSQPSNSVMGQVWYDANTSYKCLQVRDYNNSTWRGVMAGSSSCKVWLYLNAVEEGWTIDSSVTDKVLALKGGSTYTTGATSAGTWTISGISDSGHNHNHNHMWYDYQNGSDDKTFNSVGTAVTITREIPISGDYGIHVGNSTHNNIGADSYTDNDATSGNANISQSGTWRISAAVGIMARPNARG